LTSALSIRNHLRRLPCRNVSMLHIPGDLIWLPDIILYNNVQYVTLNMGVCKADVHSNGTILFEPPVIYNSMCRIDTKW
jgi:nicotinic acetylcholine receptor